MYKNNFINILSIESRQTMDGHSACSESVYGPVHINERTVDYDFVLKTFGQKRHNRFAERVRIKIFQVRNQVISTHFVLERVTIVFFFQKKKNICIPNSLELPVLIIQ